MKSKWIAAVAVVMLSGSLAIAAPHGGGKFGGKRGHRGEHGAKFAQELNLTDAQQEQIRAIRKETRLQNATFFEQMHQTRMELRAAKQANDTARADALKATSEAQRAQMKQIKDSERQRIFTLLTPEQRTKWEAFEAERKSRRGGKRGNKL